MAVLRPKTDIVNNVREARIYINALEIKCFDEPLDIRNLLQYKQEINRTLINKFNPEKRNLFVDNIKKQCINLLLPEDKFNWISKNDRACYYVWGKIRKTNITSIKEKPLNPLNMILTGSLISKKDQDSISYEELKLNKHPTSTKERLELTIRFIDLIDLSIEIKNELLNKIKDEWAIIFNKKNNLKWLNEKDKECCEWAWNYIKKHSDFCNYLSPINDHELYLCFYAAFDLWSASEDTKKLFLININKAHSQQKFRAGIKDKKALNTFISKDTKTNLDILCKEKNMKINDMLEYLINAEFKKQKN